MRSLGPKYVLLKTAKSKLFTPFCRSVASTRDSLPKPHCGGAVKHAVLNHSFSCETPAGAPLLQPATTLGLNVPIPSPKAERSEERRVGKEGRSRWWSYH